MYKPGVETVLLNGPPIGRQTFSSDLICQRMLQVPTLPPMVSPKDYVSGCAAFSFNCQSVSLLQAY